ncbi:hypothetical protein [Paenibacillus elgii]|uniref:hypothetical protein n=1 Tax=Paenibacillus elgii TaxID=189691 RepID=UPI001968A496|nr:hypothetical protein [Paenibacillus elgii]
MTQNVDKGLLLQGLLININNNLPEELFSDAAYDITKRQVCTITHPILPLKLKEVLR